MLTSAKFASGGNRSDGVTKKVVMGVGIAIAAAVILAGLIIVVILKRKDSSPIRRGGRSLDQRGMLFAFSVSWLVHLISCMCVCSSVRLLKPWLYMTVSRTGTNERSQEILLSGQIITSKRDYSGESKNADDLELPLFDLHTMAVATNNFSDANKLGQGGFGRVYKVHFCAVGHHAGPIRSISV